IRREMSREGFTGGRVIAIEVQGPIARDRSKAFLKLRPRPEDSHKTYYGILLTKCLVSRPHQTQATNLYKSIFNRVARMVLRRSKTLQSSSGRKPALWPLAIARIRPHSPCRCAY